MNWLFYPGAVNWQSHQLVSVCERRSQTMGDRELPSLCFLVHKGKDLWWVVIIEMTWAKFWNMNGFLYVLQVSREWVFRLRWLQSPMIHICTVLSHCLLFCFIIYGHININEPGFTWGNRLNSRSTHDLPHSLANWQRVWWWKPEALGTVWPDQQCRAECRWWSVWTWGWRCLGSTK